MFLGKFHELFSVWWSIVGAIVGLVEYDVSSIFELTSGGVLKPNISVGSSKTKKNTCCGVILIKFCTADAWLFYCNVAAKNPDVAKVRTSFCISLEWRHITRQRSMRQSIFHVDCVL